MKTVLLLGICLVICQTSITQNSTQELQITPSDDKAENDQVTNRKLDSQGTRKCPNVNLDFCYKYGISQWLTIFS